MREHTDDMNDMVLLGIDRDSWKGRAERLQTINADLLTELKAGLSIARRAIRPDPKNGLHDLALWTEAARFVIKAAEQRS